MQHHFLHVRLFFFFLHFWISLIYSACPYLWIKSFCSLKRIASIKTFCHFCFFLLFYILYLFFTYVFIHYRICSFFTVYWICGLKSFFSPAMKSKLHCFFDFGKILYYKFSNLSENKLYFSYLFCLFIGGNLSKSILQFHFLITRLLIGKKPWIVKGTTIIIYFTQYS